MPFACKNGRCETPCWMRKVLLAAGFYHLMFAIWAICWPCLWFDWIGVEHPNHPLMWQGVGLVMGVFGVSLILAAKNPMQHWMIVLTGLLKFTLGIIGFGAALFHNEIPLRSAWMMIADDLIWWPPFAVMIWACIRAHTGVPPTRTEPYSIREAAGSYYLSNGKTLAEASENKLLAMVFLRHFGCTFTRQILRGLEQIQREAKDHGAELVLVHMLQSGKETEYVGEHSGVARIADPRCELYRAFGLGKGGFLELFGPHVWWRGAVSIFKGCGVGHLAGDGLQMPGAFLFRDGKIISSQRAHSASDLPHLPELFQALPSPASRDTVSA
ncbi:MAG: AhpC/TSA family protein [Verrucomicrobiota bacterium]